MSGLRRTAKSARTLDRWRVSLASWARNAVAAVAPEDAVRHVDAALELAGTGDDAHRAELLAVRARALRAIHRIDDALADLMTIGNAEGHYSADDMPDSGAS